MSMKIAEQCLEVWVNELPFDFKYLQGEFRIPMHLLSYCHVAFYSHLLEFHQKRWKRWQYMDFVSISEYFCTHSQENSDGINFVSLSDEVSIIFLYFSVNLCSMTVNNMVGHIKCRCFFFRPYWSIFDFSDKLPDFIFICKYMLLMSCSLIVLFGQKFDLISKTKLKFSQSWLSNS